MSIINEGFSLKNIDKLDSFFGAAGNNLRIEDIKLSLCDGFPGHPFEVADDEELKSLTDSIRQIGIKTPLLLRLADEGRYEVVSGHRRLLAAEKCGLETVPAIVAELSRDEAVIAMVDSNLQRERIKPSERAFAYKMKMEALSHQGKNVGEESTSRDALGEAEGISGTQVSRYIRLTELIPELRKCVDTNTLTLAAAVAISFIGPDLQQEIYENMLDLKTVPSFTQATKLKEFAASGRLSSDVVYSIMTETKQMPEVIKLPGTRIRDFFEPGTPPKEIEGTICAALKLYNEINAPVAARNRDDAR
jgi:ParB family chromosome partitioning protein